MSARHERLNVLVGDVFDSGRVREAVAGNEAVISVLGARQLSNPLRPDCPGDPRGPASVGSEYIVEAMRDYGLKRLVCQTAWG